MSEYLYFFVETCTSLPLWLWLPLPLLPVLYLAQLGLRWLIKKYDLAESLRKRWAQQVTRQRHYETYLDEEGVWRVRRNELDEGP